MGIMKLPNFKVSLDEIFNEGSLPPMKFTTILSWLSSMFILTAAPLKTGDLLPDLEGTNQKGEVIKIAPKDGDEWLLIFSYPKALTPG